jgi:AcrR family transcriptional regulator
MTTPARANRREIAAAATRQEILRAAGRLFARDGYTATSVQAIATEAGVAVQTIYSSIGSKSALIVALIDTLDGEAEIGPAVAELFTSEDPHRVVQMMARIPRIVMEGGFDLMVVLRDAAPTDADAAAALAAGEARHVEGEGEAVRRLAALDALRPDLDIGRAGELAAALTSWAAWHPLRVRGWTYDEIEEGMADTLARILLRDDR